MERLFIFSGALLMLIGVGAGAFGAHGLSGYFQRFPELEAIYETAVRYHVYHALALLFVGWAVTRWPAALTHWAGYLMIAGVLIFSGTLYLLVFTRMRWLGAITPIGGAAFLAGWLCLMLAAWRG